MDQIIQYLNDVYNQIINNQEVSEIEKWNALKSFIFTYPNHEISLKVKTWFVNTYQPLFLTNELQNSFNISDDYKYLREQKIFYTSPFTSQKTKQYPEYFYHLINHCSLHYGGIPNIYNGMDAFFTEQNQNFLPLGLIDKLNDYWEKHDAIRKAFSPYAQPYGKYIEELEKYEKNMDNEALGRLGEYDFYERIKPLPSPIFTAKDLGNGFGYDIYYFVQNQEHLIEVKTTAKKDGTDFIRLTKNEFNVMQQTLNDPKAIYIVSRVFANIDENQTKDFFYTLLKFENNKLISYTDPFIEYELKDQDSEYYYFYHSNLSKERILHLMKK